MFEAAFVVCRALIRAETAASSEIELIWRRASGKTSDVQKRFQTCETRIFSFMFDLAGAASDGWVFFGLFLVCFFSVL